ncbi:MAG: metal ABC transporter permease [Phycisphaerae bacterium]
MTNFLNAIQHDAFMQQALIAGILASIAAGIVGSFVVARRITYVAAGVAHCVLGGVGLAAYLATGVGMTFPVPGLGNVPLSPMFGAIVAAVISALLIGWITLRAKQREDTVISAIWAIGMAVGVIFLSKTPPSVVDPMAYLFGNILMIGTRDLWMLVGLDVAVLIVATLFYNRFLAVSFDEEFARLRGVNVEFWYLLLLVLTALTVVLLVQVVGIILVIALLTLPVAIAGHFSRSLWRIMLIAIGIGIVGMTSGLAVSYESNLPTGATTILLIGAAYFVTVGVSYLRRRA